MGRLTSLEQEKELIAFVDKAALHFETHKEHNTFTEAEIEPGVLFAIRWGMGRDCVLVFRISEDFVPRIYQQAIKN